MKKIKRMTIGIICLFVILLSNESIYAAQNVTLKNNEKLTIASTSSKNDHWITYKAKKTGIVTLTTNAKKCKVTLCNAKKKAVTAQTSFGKSVSDAKTYSFAVKKGQTYKLKLNFSSKSIFTCKFTALNESGGNDYRSADILTLQQSAQGLTTNSEICKYYRIDVNVMSNQPIKFSVKTPLKESSGFTFDILTDTDIPLMSNVSLCGTKNYTFQSTLGPGTYYVVVKSNSKKTTGQYMISYGKDQT